MLHRRCSEHPIKTKIAELDLHLTVAICTLGFFPSPQNILHPQDFPSFRELVDYMGITHLITEDHTNDHINHFLHHMGLSEFQVVSKRRKKKKFHTVRQYSSSDDDYY